MKTPPPTQDEKRRLEVLWRYKLPDTPPEEFFDDRTTLAAQICEVSIVFIPFVNEKRQWFKSKSLFENSFSPRSSRREEAPFFRFSETAHEEHLSLLTSAATFQTGSKTGLTASETAHDISFCGHVIHKRNNVRFAPPVASGCGGVAI